MSADATIHLNDKVIESFTVGKVFKEHTKSVNSIDFTVDGKYLLSASDDDSVGIYDCETGEKSKLFYSKKYGVDHMKFVHSGPISAICSSRNEFDFSLRYWDLYENKFIRFFKGHLGMVTSLDVHPYEDLFLSSSVDKTSLLWDLRKEKPIARIPSRHSPASRFDNQGLIFGVVAGDQKVHLFDSRNFDKGEFAFFDLSRYITIPSDQVSKIDFSPCGKFIAVSTACGQLFSIDSFKGNLAATYASAGHEGAMPSFSPDSQFIACGHTSGSINVYRSIPIGDDPSRHTSIVARLDAHTSQPRAVLFNPVRCMLASACMNVALWIPRKEMDKRASAVRNSDALLEDQNQELAQFVNNILKDMQGRFNTMTDSVLSRIDDMGERIDELEKSVNEILSNSGEMDTKSRE